MFIVYALYNKERNRIYIGQTKDMEQRMALLRKTVFPNAYTARFSGDWVVIYTEQAIDRKSALQREKQLKKLPRSSVCEEVYSAVAQW